MWVRPVLAPDVVWLAEVHPAGPGLCRRLIHHHPSWRCTLCPRGLVCASPWRRRWLASARSLVYRWHCARGTPSTRCTSCLRLGPSGWRLHPSASPVLAVPLVLARPVTDLSMLLLLALPPTRMWAHRLGVAVHAKPFSKPVGAFGPHRPRDGHHLGRPQPWVGLHLSDGCVRLLRRQVGIAV